MQADQDITNISMEEIEHQRKEADSTPPEEETCLNCIEAKEGAEGKIGQVLSLMKECLSGSKGPRFREFWQLRKECLELFKEELPVKTRGELWEVYVDLSGEARRVKEILDEQSAFAYEQIDLAVESLIKDLASYQELIDSGEDVSLLYSLRSLSEKKVAYGRGQKELQFLNAFAAKVGALRKEIVKTDMRIRSKNKLFDKLSMCGDLIFPRRKELIRLISEYFIQDVANFVERNFSSSKEILAPLHVLREEIKGLQAVAKVLTLNTHAFTETRASLSQCWDVVKEKEKEKKQEFLEKKAAHQQSLEKIEELVRPFEELCSTEESFIVIEKAYAALSESLKELEIGRFEQKKVADRIAVAKKPHEEKKAKELEQQLEKEAFAEKKRLEDVQAFREQFQKVLEEARAKPLEELQMIKQQMEEMYKTLPVIKGEKVLLDRMFKQLKDRLLEAKGAALLSLSDDEQKQYAGLIEILQERKARRVEMKQQLEGYRKALGGSGFDFEKAMVYQELLQTEKSALEELDKDIQEVEKKLEQLKG